MPAGSPTLAVTLHALGGVLRDRGARAEAESAFRRALDIRVAAFPKGNAAITESATALADLLTQMGRAREAAVIRQRYGG